jgi:hypothetical protein
MLESEGDGNEKSNDSYSCLNCDTAVEPVAGVCERFSVARFISAMILHSRIISTRVSSTGGT